MNDPRVFVVQNQMRFDRDAQKLVEKFDLSPAKMFGKITHLLSPSAAPWGATIIPELREKLADYDGEKDHILLVGNPVLMGLTAAIAAQAGGGKCNFLQWSGKDGRYLSIRTTGILGPLDNHDGDLLG